ncbi:MAG: TIGR04255 family protein [Fidelibacterota bacterium]
MNNTKKSALIPSALVNYNNPPVNEVICGMRFEEPENLRIPHIGFLWEKFRADYPFIQHAAPIASGKGEILFDQATGLPLPRVWFINKRDDQLVQFQKDRFYFNWRRRQNDYPRFHHVIRNFEETLTEIILFFEEFHFGKFRPIENELTYINHIPEGEGWETTDDIPKIFSDFVWKQTKSRFLPNPEKIAWQTEFSLPEQKGRLTVNLKQAIRTEDKIPLLVLELRVHGSCLSDKREDILKWFDLAHEWIVKGFTDLTTTEIQKFWKIEKNV